MSEIKNQAVYTAVYETAKKYFQKLPTRHDLYSIKPENSPRNLYRYVSYRNGLAQPESAGRTIWTPLKNDTGNRWTGLSVLRSCKSPRSALASSGVRKRSLLLFAFAICHTPPLVDRGLLPVQAPVATGQTHLIR